MKILDLSAAVIIGGVAVAFLMMTGELGRTAALFPRILSVTIIALVVVYIGVQITSLVKERSAGSSGNEAGRKNEAAEGGTKTGRWSIIVASIAVYMGLMSLIGFGAASFVFAVALPYIGGYRRMKVVIPVAAGMTFGLMVIGRLFHIPLPEGLWTALFQ